MARKTGGAIPYRGCCAWCCDDYTYCPYAYMSWRSQEAQILLSSDVENSLGECVWDASPDGANYGGSWEISTAYGMFSDCASLSGCGGTCNI